MRPGRSTRAAAGRSALAIALTLLLTGCPIKIQRRSTAPASSPPAAKPDADPPSTPMQRTPFVVQGTYVHRGTSIAFPETAAGWTRVAPNRYDREGNDVGIGYQREVAGKVVLLTIYVFPRSWKSATEPMALDEEFGLEAAEVRKAYAGATDGPQTSGEVPFRGGVAIGRAIDMTATTKLPLGPGALVNLLTTYAFDPWRIKYRVTTATESIDAVRTAIADILTELQLPPLDPAQAPEDESER